MADARLPAEPAARANVRDAIMQFIVLLEREQQTLAQPQADALDAITQQKQMLAEKLRTLDHGASTAANRILVHDVELTQLAERAQALNTANARLLTLHRNSCENRLRLLRGGEQGNALYSASGYLGH